MSQRGTHRKQAGRRGVLLAGGALLAFLSLSGWLLRDHVRFWWLFESLGKSEQGYHEYRHRPTGIVLVRVPGGKFLMGLSDLAEETTIWSLTGRQPPPRGMGVLPRGMLRSEKPAHEVELSAFLIGKYEVTRAEWARVMGTDPPQEGGETLPVADVSWHDCRIFCQRTSLRLPTEAQWEYACRAGTTGPYSGSGHIEKIAWYLTAETGESRWRRSGSSPESRSGSGLHAVGQKEANAFGLHDVHGNVSEWCQDVYDRDFYLKPQARERDPVCRGDGPFRVHRGGASDLHALRCRSACRGCMRPQERSATLGFRVAYYPLP